MAKNDEELERRLWKEVDKVKTGMLGLAGGPPRHMQPMTAFHDEDNGAIWFFTRKDNDLVRDTGDGHAAMFCLMTSSHDFITCIGGTLTQDFDREGGEQSWNPVVAAWYPEGKDDPNLTMLRLQPEDAQVWVSHGNPIRFGWEIAKANFTKTEPNVGESRHLDL